MLLHVGGHRPPVAVRVVAFDRLQAGDAVEAAADEQLVTHGDGANGAEENKDVSGVAKGSKGGRALSLVFQCEAQDSQF